VVEIVVIAREAGGRSKVAVVSHDERVDPVGACVGVKGSRIQTIVRELAGEKIDIVPWSPDPSVLVSRALNPAKVSRALVNEAERVVRVIVPDDQLSLAIGRGGQNARLAAKLTGWGIDIVGETEHARELEIDLSQRVDVSELPGVGPKLADSLRGAGYRYVQDLDGVATEDILRVPGVGEKTADKISIAVAAVLEVLEEEKQAQLRELEEQARAEALEASRLAEEARREAEAAESEDDDGDDEEYEEEEADGNAEAGDEEDDAAEEGDEEEDDAAEEGDEEEDEAAEEGDDGDEDEAGSDDDEDEADRKGEKPADRSEDEESADDEADADDEERE